MYIVGPNPHEIRTPRQSLHLLQESIRTLDHGEGSPRAPEFKFILILGLYLYTCNYRNTYFSICLAPSPIITSIYIILRLYTHVPFFLFLFFLFINTCTYIYVPTCRYQQDMSINTMKKYHKMQVLSSTHQWTLRSWSKNLHWCPVLLPDLEGIPS